MRSGGHDRCGCLRLALAEPLIVGEEEQFVANDSAANAGAELILVIGLARGIEVVHRVHVLVAQKLIESTVEVVRPALSCGIDDLASRASELGVV